MISAPAGLEQLWTIRAGDAAAVQHIVDTTGCPRPIAEMLAARWITDSHTVQAFFNPSVDDLIDPMLMLGMAPAVARIQRAVRDAEPILIYGDYDVDGTTATVLLK